MKNRRIISETLFILSLFGLGLLILPNIMINPSGNTTNIADTDGNSDVTADKPNSSGLTGTGLTIANWANLSEECAEWLLYKARKVNGYSWNQSGIFYYNLKQGAAGIGMLFIELYKITKDIDYLNAAKQIGTYLNIKSSTLSSPGKWSEYDSFLAENFTGLERGAAGIGKFFYELYSLTGNGTILNRANEVFSYIDSIKVNEGNGTKFPWKEAININNEQLTVTKATSVYGTGSESLSNLAQDDGSEYTIASVVPSYTERNLVDTSNSYSYTMGTSASYTSDCVRISQQFHLDTYPVDLGANGVDMMLRRHTDMSGTESLRMGIFKATSSGLPNTGAQVGGYSDSIPYTSIPISNGIVNFDWSSSSPVLNGDSPYGYCIVLETQGTVGPNYFFYAISTTDSAYSKGRVSIYETSWALSLASRDLVFNISSPTGNYVTRDFSLNLTDFGISPLMFNPNYLNLISVTCRARYSVAGIDVGSVYLVDKTNNRFDPLGTFTNTETLISVSRTINLFNYLESTYRTVTIRVLSGDPSSSHNVEIDVLNVTINYNDEDYSYNRESGAAGIGEYLLDLYELSNNQTYFNLAQRAGNYLINNAIVTNITTTYYASWLFGTQGYATSISSGVAGVGAYLLRLSLLNRTNTQYADFARLCGNWLIRYVKTVPVYDHLYNSIGIGAYWTDTNSTSATNVYNGFNTGVAGIGNFLLNLGLASSAESTTNSYITYATYAGNYLISTYNNLGEFTSAKQSIYTYSWAKLARTSSAAADLTLESGTAGVIKFLNQLYGTTHQTKFSKRVSGGLEYFSSQTITELNSLYWNLTGTNSYIFGLYDGVAGIALSMLGIDFNSYLTVQSAQKAINWLYTQRHDLSASKDEYPVSEGSTIYYSGLAKGAAGVGMSYLNMFRATGNNTYFTWASYCARRLLLKTEWQVSTADTSTQIGVAEGVAGIGLFLIEMAKSSNTYFYWTTLQSLAYYVIGRTVKAGSGYSWQNSTTDTTSFYGYDYGTAGVMHFLTEMYKLTQNTTYLFYAEAAARYLDYSDVSGLWDEYPASGEQYYGFSSGAAGIAYSLLNLYEVTRNATYLNLINLSYQSLVAKMTSQSIQWRESDLDKYSGIENGQAGILKFISRYYNLNKSTTVQSTINTLNSWILGAQESEGNFFVSSDISNSYNSFRRGVAGVISGLISSYESNIDESLLGIMDNAKDYLVSHQKTVGSWNDSTDATRYLGYYDGVSGIVDQMIQVPDLSGPYLSELVMNMSNLANMQYFNSLKLDIVSNDVGSGLEDVVLVYKINQGTWNELSFNDLGSDLFSTLIAAQYYNTNITFYVVAIDQSGILTIDNNQGQLYSYRSKDERAPQIKSIYTSDLSDNLVPIQYATGGKILVKVDEPTLASGISQVRITYDNIILPGGPTTTNMQFVTGSDNIYQVIIPGTNFIYGHTIQYNLTITDVAGNSNVTTQLTTTVGDSQAPNIDYENTLVHQSVQIPTLTSVSIKVPVYDDLVNVGESGIASVYINYTTDNGNTWKTVTLTYDSFNDWYAGSIPGQTWFGVNVRYMICVTDNAGNGAFYDSAGNKYTNPALIPINFLFRYTIVINWVITIIIVAIIAAISVFIYYMVARRGDYWSRMRRQADGAAVAISIQEKFTNVYYGIMGRLNAMGTWLTKKFSSVPGEPHKVKDWFEEHMSDAMVAFLTKVKLAFKALIKGIGMAIISPLYLIAWLVKKTGGMQAIMSVLISLLMIIFPVIKYVTEPPYPQAALFFINLGFVLFISSFLLLIFHLIYRIAYK